MALLPRGTRIRCLQFRQRNTPALPFGTRRELDAATRSPQVLSLLHSNADTEIDGTVGNPARITKLYGTWVRKGDTTPERPHRVSNILEIPPDLKAVDKALLERIAERAPKARDNQRHYGGPSTFNLEAWLKDHNCTCRQFQTMGRWNSLCSESMSLR